VEAIDPEVGLIGYTGNILFYDDIAHEENISMGITNSVK